MKTIRMFISGNVQGVFFRRFIKENADKLNVRGFVRNLEDGRVEVVAEGKDENVNEFLKKCREGSAHSNVKKVENIEIKHQSFDGFKILSL